MTRLFQVSTPYFVAGAEFVEDRAGNSLCIKAAPIIKWMVNRSLESVKYIIKRKTDYSMQEVKHE